MYIITAKQNHQIVGIGNTISYSEDNGYLKLDHHLATFPPQMIDIYKVKNIPSNVTPLDWAYINNEFLSLNIEETLEVEERDYSKPLDIPETKNGINDVIIEVESLKNVGSFIPE